MSRVWGEPLSHRIVRLHLRGMNIRQIRQGFSLHKRPSVSKVNAILRLYAMGEIDLTPQVAVEVKRQVVSDLPAEPIIPFQPTTDRDIELVMMGEMGRGSHRCIRGSVIS